MGTEVLRPQDCLIQRIRVAPAVFHRRNNYYGNGNGNGIHQLNNNNRKPTVRSGRPDQRRRSKRSASANDLRSKQPQKSINSKQVTILKRGESLDTKIKGNGNEEMTVYGTGRLGPGPDPGMVAKQVRLGLPDMYAGSAFTESPSPRSLPLPSFFRKNEGVNSVDDSATRDLRRLLRLD